jgi:glutamine synthetase
MTNKVLELIKQNEAKWVDLRFTDIRGKEQHVSFPAYTVSEDTFVQGKMFDGSSLAGWKGIEASDMILMPDPETAFMDPFFDESTVVVTCDIIEPSTMQGYERDPRSIARRAEEYLKATGIADTAYFGPEPEFFVFDEVKWDIDMSGARHTIYAEEAAWSTNKDYEGGNTGHRPRVKGGYFPVPPIDSAQDLRVAMCNAIEAMVGEGKIEVQHHEVASCQSEIGVAFNTLVRKADEVQVLKYAVHNVAHAFGKTATFMPKPLVGDNGSGMHVHQSLSKDGKNLFSGDQYGGLSELALYLHWRYHQACSCLECDY